MLDLKSAERACCFGSAQCFAGERVNESLDLIGSAAPVSARNVPDPDLRPTIVGRDVHNWNAEADFALPQPVGMIDADDARRDVLRYDGDVSALVVIVRLSSC